MAAGYPVKANYATGDVLTAANMNDLSATVNYAVSTTPTTATQMAGKNKIINGDFFVNQRNIDSTGTTGGSGGTDAYTLDRWASNYVGGTVTTSCQQFTAGTAPVSGYEAKQFARMAVSGQVEGAGNNYALFYQKIEDVRTFAGQAIVFSFWAKANSGTPKLALVARQNFGSGGSPSANVDTNLGTVTLSTSWARYSVTATLPSISGKTIGTTANTSNLQMWVMPSCTTNFGFGQSIGIQNFTMDIWGVQLEAGSTATPFQTATGSIQGELAACQRYYLRSTAGTVYGGFGIGNATATTAADIFFYLPTVMRIQPTTLEYANLGLYQTSSVIALTALTVSHTTSTTIRMTANVSSGLTSGGFTQMLANNSTSAYLGFSAEL